jgi:hypothetical protein
MAKVGKRGSINIEHIQKKLYRQIAHITKEIWQFLVKRRGFCDFSQKAACLNRGY